MARDVIDFFSNLLGGMHGGIHPLLLRENQYAKGVNLSSRGGLVKTRPGLKLISSLGKISDFKGAAIYSLNDADRLVYALGSTIYSLNLSTFVTTEFQTTLNPNSDRFHFAQIWKYFVIQDGYNEDAWEDVQWPFILNGDSVYDDTAIREGESPQHAFPKGSIMAFGQGRAFVAVDWVWVGTGWEKSPRTSFVAGDINKAWEPVNVLLFSESDSLETGGAISVPNELGLITGMAFQRNVQSGTGGGPLIVFCQHGSASFAVDVQRQVGTGAGADQLDWKTSQFGKVLFHDGGMEATYSIASVNSDLIYRAHDGIRTLRYGISQGQSQGVGLSNESISNEVSDFLDTELKDQALCSAAFAKNRYAVVTNKDSEGFKWNGLVVLDTTPVSAITAPATPVYDGVWTGLKFMSVLSGRYNDNNDLIILGENSGGNAGVYVLDDKSNDSENISIQSRLETRYFHFGAPFDMKTLKHINVWLEGITGRMDFTIYYRADGFGFWKIAGTSKISSSGDNPGRVRSVRIFPSETEASPDDQVGDAHAFYSVQFCFEFIGRGKISKVEIVSSLIGQDIYEEGVEKEFDVGVAEGGNFISINDYEYMI